MKMNHTGIRQEAAGKNVDNFKLCSIVAPGITTFILPLCPGMGRFRHKHRSNFIQCRMNAATPPEHFPYLSLTNTCEMSATGQKISSLRKSRGLTQEELSENARVNLRTIQRIESGDTEPRVTTLRALCSAMNVNIEEVIETGLQENRSILFWLHLTPAAVYLLPLGNIILPLIIWLSHKDRTMHVREQGAGIINFQIIWYVVTVIIIGILLIGLTDYKSVEYMMLLLLVTNVIYPVIVAIRVRKGKIRNYYPALIRFIR